MYFPKEITYVDQNSCFNDFLFGHINDTKSDPAWTAFHHFASSGIAGVILPVLKKQKEEGQLVFVMPETLQKLALSQEWEGIVPKKLFFDLRNESHKERDRLGVPHNSLNT